MLVDVSVLMGRDPYAFQGALVQASAVFRKTKVILFSEITVQTIRVSLEMRRMCHSYFDEELLKGDKRSVGRGTETTIGDQSTPLSLYFP